MVFLQSYMIMPDGHSLETENKRICQISGLKWSKVSGLALANTYTRKDFIKLTRPCTSHAKRYYYSSSIGRGIHVGDHFLLFLMTLYSSKS